MAQWLEHRSVESEGLRFDFSWRFRIFLCPMLFCVFTFIQLLSFYLPQTLWSSSFFFQNFLFIEFTDLFTFLFQEKDAKHIPLQVINNALRKGTDSHGMIYDGHRSINDSS